MPSNCRVPSKFEMLPTSLKIVLIDYLSIWVIRIMSITSVQIYVLFTLKVCVAVVLPVCSLKRWLYRNGSIYS